MGGKEFFAQYHGQGEYCKLIQDLPEEEKLRWELEQVSDHSPGPVDNGEVLCRQVVDPVHYDNVSGTIKPNFFDDASSVGASCHRMSHVSEDVIRSIAVSRVDAANLERRSTGTRSAIGYATISAEEVRAITASVDGKLRGAAVYDTAKATDSSHADICQIVSGRQAGRSIRNQLWLAAKGNLKRF